jgi:uncharacterized protein YkwD
MMAALKKLWPIIGIFLLLTLVACGSNNSTTQVSQTAPTQSIRTKATRSTTSKTMPAVAIQINITSQQAKPAPRANPTARLAASPSVSGNNGSSPTTTTQVQQLSLYVFELINHDRLAMGLPAYRWSNALAGGAHLHNLRMMAYGQLSNQCPGEPDLGTRITNDGIAWRSAGENIGWSNYPDPQQGVLSNYQGMMAEKPPNDGHRQNILSANFNMVGIDVLVDAHQNVWLTEDFAQA